MGPGEASIMCGQEASKRFLGGLLRMKNCGLSQSRHPLKGPFGHQQIALSPDQPLSGFI
jgi:hypothetical protein